MQIQSNLNSSNKLVDFFQKHTYSRSHTLYYYSPSIHPSASSFFNLLVTK